MKQIKFEPDGKLVLYSERGHTAFPKQLQRHLNLRGKVGEEVNYFYSGKAVLLVGHGATMNETMLALNQLKIQIMLRWEDDSLDRTIAAGKRSRKWEMRA